MILFDSCSILLLLLRDVQLHIDTCMSSHDDVPAVKELEFAAGCVPFTPLATSKGALAVFNLS